MVKLLKAVAFALVVFMAIAATRPFNAADTFAAERPVNRVILIDEAQSELRTFHDTTARNVGEFLDEIGVHLGPHDQLHPHYRRRIEGRTTVEINRAFYIDLVIDGIREEKLVAPGTTTGEFLSNLQMERDIALLYGSDKNAYMEEGTVNFSTWRSERDTVVEYIPYDTEYVSTQSLSMGVEKVRQEGEYGEIHRYYEVVFIGNEEYMREFSDENVIDPVTRIVDRGVGGALGTLTDTSCPSFRYVRRVTMNASAYTAGFCCTGKSPGHPWYGITASGRHVEHGIVAVDPQVIPLGTRLYVEGYGFALAADTGSAIRGYKIDLFMYELEDARRFGRRDITVFILD